MSDAIIGKEAVKDVVSCPYCNSVDTELFSLFGSQLLTVQYYCNTCHTPFEYILKEEDELANNGRVDVATLPDLNVH